MITLIVGPMYGGKSTALIQKMERYIYAKKSICFIRPIRDDRGYITHNGLRDVQQKLTSRDLTLEILEFTEDLVKRLEQFDAVFIDEYFMIHNCKLLCTNSVKPNIYFAGLLATSENELFEETKEILPYCDDIIKLNGVCCECGSDTGNYSMYKANNKTEAIVVGDNEYECVCRDCYRKIKGHL